MNVQEESKPFSCRNFIAPYIINPQNRYKVIWDNFIGIVFLLSFIFDPINFAFDFEPMYNDETNRMDLAVTILLCTDMLFDLVTGIEKENIVIPINDDDTSTTDNTGMVRRGNAKMLLKHQQRSQESLGVDDPTVERDIGRILKSHFKSQFWFDALANFPIVIFYIWKGRPVGEEEVVAVSDDLFFVTAMGLKVLRLVNLTNFTNTLRFTMDKIANMFYLHRYMLENIYNWIQIILKFILVIHYFACGWQLIRFYKLQKGYVSHPF